MLWDLWPICDKIQEYNSTYIFCASRQQFADPNDLKGICDGDSGGPIVDLQPGIYTLQKNQKLCQNQNSKWRNFAMALIIIINLVSITDAA